MEENSISKLIWDTREQDKKLFPDRIWFKVYYIVYPLSVWFANRRVKPNSITLLMLPSALLAAFLFFTGNIVCVIIGAFVIQLFQIFDYSDGKVARATNQKSKYGKELDFLMHVICHPIVFLSFSGLLKMTNSINPSIIWIIVLVGAIIESAIRSLKNLVDAMDSKNSEVVENRIVQKRGVKFILDSIYNGLVSFPCFMSVLPFIAIIEYFFKTNHSIHIVLLCVLVQIAYNAIYMIRMIFSVLKRCMRS